MTVREVMRDAAKSIRRVLDANPDAYRHGQAELIAAAQWLEQAASRSEGHSTPRVMNVVELVARAICAQHNAPNHLAFMRDASAAISALMKALAEPMNPDHFVHLHWPSHDQIKMLLIEVVKSRDKEWRAMLAQFARENVGMEEE